MFKYKLKEIGFILKGESNPIKLSKEYVMKIEIIKLFDENFFPIVRVSANIPVNDYYKILASPDAKVNLMINTYIDSGENANYAFEKPFINSLFQLYTDDDTPFLDKMFANKEVGLQGENKKDQVIPFQFYLFKVEHIRRYRKIINTVFRSAPLTDAVIYGFNQCGIDKVLMTPLANRGSFSNAIMPPCNLLGFIDNLNTRYGLYTTGYRIFQDFDVLYLLDRSEKCTAYREKEYKEVYFQVAEYSSNQSLIFGSYDDKDNMRYVVNIPMNAISVSRVNNIVKDAMHNGIITVNTANNKVTKSNAKLVTTGTDVNYMIYEKKFNHGFMETAHNAALETNNIVISMFLNEFNANIFTLNKEFVFTFVDPNIAKSLNGSYAISSLIMSLERDGENYLASGTCDFKRK